MSGILVVGPAWVGDIVMTQSLLKTLRDQHPDTPVDVLAQGWSVSLARRMPEVREAIELPAGHGELNFRQLRRLAAALRARSYEQAVVCPRSAKAALVPFLARIPRRTGFRGEFRYGLLNDIRPLDKTVLRTPGERWTALGLPRDAELPPRVREPALRVDPENRDRLLREWSLEGSAPAVALAPGAEHGSAKRWPAEYFGELARRLLEDGFAVWILGSPRDRDIAGTIIECSGPGPVNLCGETTLVDAADLLSTCRAAVTNDSGLMHVAAAVGTHVVALYGSSTPRYTPPLTERATVHYLDLECSPCFAQECPLGHHRCMRDITPADVLDSLARAVPEGPPRRVARPGDEV